jgi:uncharacterized membrane protein
MGVSPGKLALRQNVRVSSPSADERETQGLERTIFFSDAVIAIAMTLLALELPIPAQTAERTVWESFAHNFGNEYISFLISFAVIGAFWFSHHRFFQDVARINHPLVFLNLLSLVAIVLVPFATKVLSVNNENSFGPMFYASVMVLFGLAYVLMVLAADRAGLWREGTPPSAAGNKIFGISAALGIFALSIPLSFVDVNLAKLSWLLTPVVATLLPLLRARLRARVPARAPAPAPAVVSTKDPARD